MAFDPFDPNVQARTGSYFGVAAADGQPLQYPNVPWGAGGPLAAVPAPPAQGTELVAQPGPLASMPEPVASVQPPVEAAPQPVATEASPAAPAAPAAPAVAAHPPPHASTGPAMPSRSRLDAANARTLGTYGREAEATQAQAQAEQAKNTMQADAMHEAETQRQAGLEEQAAIDKQHSEQFTADMEELRAERARIAEMKVDPQRVMTKGGGLQALAIIGGALGGLSSGMNGGPNVPLEALNKRIDRDIEEQRREIDAKKGKVSDDMNALSLTRAKWSDDRTATMQLKSMAFESMKGHVQAEAQRYDNPIVQARADALVSGIDREQSKLDASIEEHRLAQAKAAAAAQAHAADARRKEAIELAKWNREMALKEQVAGGSKKEAASKDAERFVAVGSDKKGAPTGFLARSPAEASKFSTQLQALDAMEASLNRVLKIRSDTGTVGRALNRSGLLNIYTPEWQSNVKAEEANVALALKGVENAGALDAGMQEVASTYAGGFQSVGSSGDESARHALKMLSDKRASILRNTGAQKASKGVDESGEERVNRTREYYAPLPAMPAPRKVY